ncbi:alpha amylase [Prevotella sp. CAG:1092]|mgnify:FL=1|nr:alpha-amylase family glycosyl hydrolase [Prevotella sp.]MDY4151819.1 alpha-amylase family glycosyl hydrolase [Prevotella sp.]CCZ12247.1 alpha amylase [Prevotella sp. CAG:1092]
MTKHLLPLLLFLGIYNNVYAQGWPANYGGVMLQGFYWNSYDDTNWTNLKSQVNDFADNFSLVWLPQSGKCLGNSQTMGYKPYYYFNQNSSFGTEAELRDLIKTFKGKGIGMVADVVVNHHDTDGWFTFPAEVYKGVTYQFKSTDIVANDDKGKTAKEATKQGISLSKNNDEGEDWDGCRDLDHKSQNVQTIIKAYLKYLKDDLGYTGFRYDMVKGFSGSHVADYNKSVGVEYSVGEYWDSNARIQSWINATLKNSAAFDFQFRYNVRDAINSNNWAALKSTNNLINDKNWRQYAVTFVENHDMEYRSSSEQQDPIRRDTLAANAYLLAMPGTPCVFFTHWLEYKDEIGAMISARKVAGITNMSDYEVKVATSAYYAVNVNKTLYAAVGRLDKMENPGADWQKVLSGYHYAYFLNKSLETAFVDKASGIRDNSFKVKLIAVSKDASAKLVYTTDGTAPTAKSKQVASGDEITISSDCVLKVGLLVGGSVKGIITRNYTIQHVEEGPDAFETPAPGYTYNAYFVAPATWKNEVKCWAWTKTANYTGGTWPGEKCYKIGKNGKQYIYQWCYYGTLTTPPTSIIFNNNGSAQTDDLTFVNGAYYDIKGKTTGISTPQTIKPAVSSNIYSLDGRIVRRNASSLDGLSKGIYVYQGKKVVVK